MESHGEQPASKAACDQSEEMDLFATTTVPQAECSEPVGDKDATARPLRRRRTREDVTARIRDAACALFAERGYHFATTREIANRAAVSETLLFRHFGSKAALFDEVVRAPFDAVIKTFTQKRRSLSDDAEIKAGEYDVYAAIYDLFEKKPALFSALLSSPGLHQGNRDALPVSSLLSFSRICCIWKGV